MCIPESMTPELESWNNGEGIDLEGWVGCVGNFQLAVGYITIFWPEFIEFEEYILRKGFSEEALRGFEDQEKRNKLTVEAVMNHLHIADIQHFGCEDISKDKLILLGNTLKEIYEAKLQLQFPGKTFTVSFHVPNDEDDLMAYEITFWQKAYE